MAVELKAGNGRGAVAAERLPQQLDDAIKKCLCPFYDAGILSWPPRPPPATHKVKGRDHSVRCKLSLGVSKNDEDKLCEVMMVALKELSNEDNLDPED
eukprot:5410980-Pyramimonas_sp.AAC.1